MQNSSLARHAFSLQQCQTIVIKVGSAMVANHQAVTTIAHFIEQLAALGKHVVLVSSGAVAAGRLQIKQQTNNDVLTKQALAAIGQLSMIQNWQQQLNQQCAQLLVTHQDFHDRRRYLNIRNTVRELLSLSALPIFNENDSVATAELKFGDNDNLAALVAIACDADALLILSDIDALYSAPPHLEPTAEKIATVPEINAQIWAMAGATANKQATGGMLTKIQAAEKATKAGIATYILKGSDDQQLQQWLSNQQTGTHFVAQASKQSARQLWLYRGLQSKGQVTIDDGACRALKQHGASLLAVGIVSVLGDFNKGDAIDVLNTQQQLIGRGISQYSHLELQKIKGLNQQRLSQVLGFEASTLAIHRDDFVRAN